MLSLCCALLALLIEPPLLSSAAYAVVISPPAVPSPAAVPSAAASGRMAPLRRLAQAELPTIVVEDSGQGAGGGRLHRRSMESAEDSTGFVEVIDTREVWRGFETVGELLSQSVGVQLKSMGARDDFATLSVRGAPSSQVKILLDGVSLNRAQNQVVNISDLPMDAVERIEIYRGFTPISVTSSGASSVVNIITRRGGDRTTASLSYGSFGSAKLSAGIDLTLGSTTSGGSSAGSNQSAEADTALDGSSGDIDDINATSHGSRFSAFLTLKRSDGDFEFVDDKGTVTNPDDDSVEKRRNNKAESADLLLRYSTAVAGGSSFTLSQQLFYKDEGLPGLGSDQSLHAALESLRNISSLSWNSADKTLAIEADATFLHQDLSDPRKNGPDESDRSRLGLPYERALNDTTALSLSARRSKPVGAYHLLETGFEGAWELFEGDTFDSLRQGEKWQRINQERNSLAIVAGDEIWMAPWNLAVALQLRHERLWNRFNADPSSPFPSEDGSNRESSTNPRLGLRWEAMPGLSLKANVSSYFRPPAFGELFGDQGFSVANPGLRSESGINRDVGLMWSGNSSRARLRWDIEYVYFNNDSEDTIVVVQTSSRKAKAVNVDDARVRGHELRLEASSQTGISLSANYTKQDSFNLSRLAGQWGKELPGLAPEEAHTMIVFDRGSWSLAYETEFTGKHFTDIINTPGSARTSIDSRLTHNISLTLSPFDSHWQITAEVENLGDSLVPDVFGFPVPGRAWYLTVSYALAAEESHLTTARMRSQGSGKSASPAVSSGPVLAGPVSSNAVLGNAALGNPVLSDPAFAGLAIR